MVLLLPPDVGLLDGNETLILKAKWTGLVLFSFFFADRRPALSNVESDDLWML